MDAKVNTVQEGSVWQVMDCIYRRQSSEMAPDALAHARRAWLDTLACMVGGAGEPVARVAARASKGNSAESSALILGAASHALDYDDVCMLATCHPSAPVVSALLAWVDRVDGDVQLSDLLAAHLVGTEIMLRLGAWLGFRHYALGFHATSTLGVIGAAAACAHLSRLSVSQLHTALAIAASSAGGLRANFGTDTKPLHVGFAASDALRALALTLGGATASDDALPAFASAFTGGGALGPIPFDANTPWAVLAPGFEIKRYPSCYMTHRMIAGILKLRERHMPVFGADPARISVLFPPGGTAPLKHPQPTKGLEAKFSAPYCAAAAWVDGAVGLGSFTDEAVLRADLRKQMSEVVVAEREGSHEPLELAPVRVTVETGSGAETLLVDWAPGSLQDEVSDRDLLAKWADCSLKSGIALDTEVAVSLIESPMDTNFKGWLSAIKTALHRHAAKAI